MAIFNSYVSLPEGFWFYTVLFFWLLTSFKKKYQVLIFSSWYVVHNHNSKPAAAYPQLVFSTQLDGPHGAMVKLHGDYSQCIPHQESTHKGYTFIHIHIHIHLHIYTYTYIYIYTFIHTHRHIYIYLYPYK